MSKAFQVNLTAEQLQSLNSALIEAPYRVAAPLIAHINAEIQRGFDARVDGQCIPSGAPPHRSDMTSGD